MKNLIALILLTLVITNPVFSQQWEELKGDHFIVYFTLSQPQAALYSGGNKEEDARRKKFAGAILDKAEDYYSLIATDLGYPRYSEFWTWEKRVKVYVYPDKESFLEATEQPQWSQGMADYNNKNIASYLSSGTFIDTILPHEIAHLIYRDFVGFEGEIPLWLDEGVAQWEEAGNKEKIKAAIKELHSRDALLSIDDMMRIDVRRIKENDRVFIRPTTTKDGKPGVLILDSGNFVNTYYLQAASLVGFLIEKFGSVEFANFSRQLRDGKNLEDSLTSVYHNHIHSLKEFEQRWREYIESGL
jgi:hypothetical protein